jgi:chemotaxis signal transduction protein
MSDYVTFLLDGRSYAARLTTIREVVRLGELVTLPGMELPVAGVLDLRGVSLPVVDIRPVPGAEGDVLVLHGADGEAQFGFACDAVTAVISAGDLPAEDSSPAIVNGQALPSYVETVLRSGDGAVFLVDVFAMAGVVDAVPVAV